MILESLKEYSEMHVPNLYFMLSIFWVWLCLFFNYLVRDFIFFYLIYSENTALLTLGRRFLNLDSILLHFSIPKMPLIGQLGESLEWVIVVKSLLV